MSGIHEECGVFGIYCRDGMNVVSAAYYALYALQHRGQESCGIAVNDDGVIRCVKNPGLVNEVITREAVETLGEGRMAVGHVRYGTSGADPRQNAQPLVVNHIKGYMALAHNGALTNARELREELELRGSIFHDQRFGSFLRHHARAALLKVDRGGRFPEHGRAQGRVFDGRHVAAKLIAARDPLASGRCAWAGSAKMRCSRRRAARSTPSARRSNATSSRGDRRRRRGRRPALTARTSASSRSAPAFRVHPFCPPGLGHRRQFRSLMARARGFVPRAGAPRAGGRGHRRAGFRPDAAIGFPASPASRMASGLSRTIHRLHLHPADAGRPGETRCASSFNVASLRCAASAWCRWTIPSCAADLGAHRQRCCARRGRPRCTCARPRRSLRIPATSAPTSTAATGSSPAAGIRWIRSRTSADSLGFLSVDRRGQARGQFPWLLHGLLHGNYPDPKNPGKCHLSADFRR